MENDKETVRSRRIYRITVLLYIAATLVCAVGRWMETKAVWPVLVVLLSLAYLFIMPLLFRIFRLRPGYLMAALLDIFIFMAFTLGTGMRWYDKIGWFDLLAHGLSGVLFTLFGICAFHLLREDKHQPRANGALCVGFSFCFANMIAGLWEIVEYTMFLATGYDSQHVADTGVGDTMEDMMICLLGAVVACILLAVHLKTSKKLLLFAPTDEFCRLNQKKGDADQN